MDQNTGARQTAVATMEQLEVRTICDLLLLEVARLRATRTGIFDLVEARGAIESYKCDTTPMDEEGRIQHINELAKRRLELDRNLNPWNAYRHAIEYFAKQIDIGDQNDYDWP